MKKLIIVGLALAVFAWNSNDLYAKDKGKGKEKSAGAKTKQVEKENHAEEKATKIKGKTDVEERKAKKAKKVKGKKEERIRAYGKDVDPAKKKGKGHQQQIAAIEKQIAHENAKHLKRVTKLERIKVLASEKNNTNTVDRVGKLLQKEQKRYEKKLAKINRRLHNASELKEKEAKAKGKAEKAKNKDKDKDEHKHEHGEKDDD